MHPTRLLSLGPRLLVAVALVALVTGCHDPESNPTTPTEATTSANPAGPTVASVELIGPARLTFGESAQFSVIVHLSNSATEVPTAVRWLASPSGFLQVDSSGLATGGSDGGGAAVTANVTTSAGLKSVSKSVVVVPADTFFLTGAVSDAEFPDARIFSAHVEVTPGPPVAGTGSDGHYRLYGVPRDSTITVTADGYEPHTQSLALRADTVQNFLLTASHPHLRLAGNYTLALDAIEPCSSSDTQPLRADLQHRRYDAVVTQNGLRVDVALSGSRFSLNDGHGDHFSGRLDGTGALTFALRQYEDSWDWNVVPVYPDVVELLPDGTYLVTSGTAVTTGSAAGMSGTLDSMNLWASTYPTTGVRLAGCSGIRFTLTPR